MTTKHGFRPIKYSLNDEFEINRIFLFYLKTLVALFVLKNILKYVLRLLNQFPGNVEFVAYHHNFVATFFSIALSKYAFVLTNYFFFFGKTFISYRVKKIFFSLVDCK